MAMDEWLKRRRITLLPKWPACSPDANPVEQVNAILGRAVQLRGPIGEHELEQFLLEEWEKLPQSLFDDLVRSCPSRWERIVAGGGDSIKP